MSDILECVFAELKAYISSESERIISEKLERLLIGGSNLDCSIPYNQIKQLQKVNISLNEELEMLRNELDNALSNVIIDKREFPVDPKSIDIESLFETIKFLREENKKLDNEVRGLQMKLNMWISKNDKLENDILILRNNLV